MNTDKFQENSTVDIAHSQAHIVSETVAKTETQEWNGLEDTEGWTKVVTRRRPKWRNLKRIEESSEYQEVTREDLQLREPQHLPEQEEEAKLAARHGWTVKQARKILKAKGGFQKRIAQRFVNKQNALFEVTNQSNILEKFSLVLVKQHLGIGATTDVADVIFSRAEDLGLLLHDLYTITDPRNLVTRIVAYAKTFHKGSLLNRLRVVITEVVKSFTGSDQPVKNQSDTPGWLECLRLVRTDWKLAIENEAFARFSQMIVLLVTVGAINSELLDINYKGIQLFSQSTKNLQTSAVDVVDAFCDLSMYFIEGGYQIFTIRQNTGDWDFTPLLYADASTEQFDKDYRYLVKASQYAFAGNLDKVEPPTTEHEFEQKLMSAIDTVRRLVLSCTKASIVRKLTIDKENVLLFMQAEFLQKRSGASLREQPYCLIVHGDSAMAKTTIIDQLGESICRALGFPIKAEFKEEYQSNAGHQENARSHTIWLNYDDLGNKVTVGDNEELEHFRKQSGNTRVDENMAALNLKGKVTANKRLITASTNVPHLNAAQFSNEPLSVMRRFHDHIHVTMKPEFANKAGQFDYNKAQAGIIPGSNGSLYNVWNFTLYRAIAIPKSAMTVHDLETKRAQDYQFVVTCDEKGDPLENIDFIDLNAFLCRRALAHQTTQRAMLTSTATRQALTSEMSTCQECSMLTVYCACSKCTTCGRVTCRDKLQCSFDRTEEGEAVESLNKRTELKAVEIMQAWQNAKAAAVIPSVSDLSKIDTPMYNQTLSEKIGLISTKMLSVTGFFEECASIVWETIFQVVCVWQWFPLLSGWVEEQTFDLYVELDRKDWNFTYLLPRSFLKSRRFRNFLSRVHTQELKKKYHYLRFSRRIFIALLVLSLLATYWLTKSFNYYLRVWLPAHIIASLFIYALQQFFKWRYLSELVKREVAKPNLPKTLENMRKEHSEYAGTIGLTVMGMGFFGCIAYGLKKVYNISRTIENQGGGFLPDQDPAELLAQKKAIFKEAAASFTTKSVVVEKGVTGQTARDSINALEKNICFLTCSRYGKDLHSTGVTFLDSNVCFVNTHALAKFKDGDTLTFIRKQEGQGGNWKFTSTYYTYNVIFSRGDISLLFVSNSGSFKSLRKYLPDEYTPGEGIGHLLTRQKEGTLKVIQASYKCILNAKHVTPGIFTSRVVENYGAEYLGASAFECGNCGSPFVSVSGTNSIIGFHQSGGVQKVEYGNCVTVYKTMLDEAMVHAATKTALFRPFTHDEPVQNQSEVKLVTSDAMDSRSVLVGMEGNYEFLGSNTQRAHPKSQIVPSIISEYVTEHMENANVWGPPKFKGEDGHSGHKPWEDSLKQSTNTNHGLPPEHLAMAVDDYIEDLTTCYNKNAKHWKKEIRPATEVESVSGRDGCRFWDAINFSTSIGFGHSGTKEDVAIECDPAEYPEQSKPRLVEKEFFEEAQAMYDRYKDGKMARPVYKACLKDEPKEKTSSKVRVFQCGALANLLLIRKYFMAVAAFICLNPLVSECTVGVSQSGTDWEDMMQNLRDIDGESYIAMDYKAYDLQMSVSLIMAAFKVLNAICALTGNFTEEELLVMEGMAYDIAHSLVSYNGDVIGHIGSNPSGNPLTVIINSIVNSLMFRCAWFAMSKMKFKKGVRLITYGDDSGGNAGRNTWFNMIYIRDYFAKHNIVITMAEKTAAFKKFVTWDEIDFLKRKATFCPFLGISLGALNPQSIFKQLHTARSEASCSQEEAACNSITKALDEFMYHGKKVFERRRDELLEVANAAGLAGWVPGFNRNYHMRVREFALDHFDDLCNSISHRGDNPTKYGFYQFYQDKLNEKMEEEVMDTDSQHDDDVIMENQACDLFNETQIVLYIKPVCELTRSLQMVKQRVTTNFHETSSEDSTNKIVTFQDGTAESAIVIPGSTDSTRSLISERDTSLQGFFGRPVKIKNFVWSTDFRFNETFNPHAGYWNDPRVNNRMNNYELMQYKLKLKFVINGGSFYSGRLMVAYQPLHLLDATSQVRATVPQDDVQLSQLPHVFLNPTSSDGAEITVPFIWMYDYVSISRFEMESLGRLVIRELQPLRHANVGTAAPNVSLTVFASVEDLNILMPTSEDNSQLVPQSLDIQNQADEIDTAGKISVPATAVSKVAGTVAKLYPPIAPLATGIQLAAGATADVAKRFGYSRPVKAEGSTAVNPQIMGNLANYNVPDSCVGLGLDVKNSVTVDPAVIGVTSEDEQSLASIASRESYLTSFDWKATDTQSKLLFNIRVDPCMFRSNTLGTDEELHFTSLCTAALPFKYWTGSIKIRFQICSAAMHKGRLRLVYDPRYLGDTVGEEYNINHSHIIDIAETNDLTISVGRGQRESLMRHCTPGADSETQLTSTSRYVTAEQWGNGIVGVYVVNELTVPNSSITIDQQTVGINVFVSGDTDMEFYEPTDLQNSYCFGLENQSETIQNQSADVDAIQKEAKAVDNPTIQLAAGHTDTKNLGVVYAGERILSNKQLLKRYCLARLSPKLAGTLAIENDHPNVFKMEQGFLPLYRGYTDGASDYRPAGATADFDVANVTNLHYWTAAYLTARGSRRYKVMLGGSKTNFNTTAESYHTRYVTRNSGHLRYNEGRFAPSASGTFNSSAEAIDTYNRANQLIPNGITGAHVTSGDQNMALEFEIPYYSNQRFIPIRTFNMRQASYQSITTLMDTSGFTYTATLPAPYRSARAEWGQVETYVAAGEDFTLSFWMGMPPLIYKPVNP